VCVEGDSKGRLDFLLEDVATIANEAGISAHEPFELVSAD